jgi:FkbM family methyltransferase
MYQDTDFREALRTHADLSVMAFEPNPTNLAKVVPDPRLVVVPVALSNATGFLPFKPWSPTGGSILDLGPGHDSYLPPEARSLSPDRLVEVPVLRLSDILLHIGDDVSIEYLKSDAQGADLLVVVGAGDSLRRIRAVTVECQDLSSPSDARVFYKGACLVSDLVLYMASQGFSHHECVMQNAQLAEHNCHFGRSDADLQFARTAFRGL